MSTLAINSAIQTLKAHPERAQQATDTLDAILRRSATDRSFRQKLVTDPKAALTEYAGHAMPDTLNVKFVERQGHYTIVLPAAAGSAVELNDAELEMVAGGVVPIVAYVVVSSTECVATALALGAAICQWFD